MDELIKMLDENLKYVSHIIEEDRFIIYVISLNEEAICPYCKETSRKVHSHYNRSLQDLPIQGKKVVIKVNHRKFFCLNETCSHKTFAETLSIAKANATKTNRLQNEILRIALSQSSVCASKYIKESIAKVGKSTICNLLKKRETYD